MNLLFLLLFSSNLWASDATTRHLEKLQTMYLVNGCTIHDSSGAVVLTLPGRICIFFDSGDFISATDTALRFITKDNEVKWELPGHFHHQVNLSVDGKRILAINSNVFSSEGMRYREDKLQVISLEGKVLHEQLAQKLLKDVELSWPDWDNTRWVKEMLKAEKEISHFNSIYEIPKITQGNKNSFFKEGDILVNGNGQGVFVLSPDLQEVRHHRFLSDKSIHATHDVQVTDRGTLLVFNNQTSDSLQEDAFSTIQEYAPPRFRVSWEFRAKPKEMFYSRSCGGVQDVGGGIIQFSDHMTGTYFYSKVKRDLVWTVRGTHFQNEELRMTQQTKLLDLSAFLASRE